MGAFRIIDAARGLTAAIAVALAVVFATEAPAAEGPALPPAEYTPLPVGTSIEYDNRTYTITRSEGYTTIAKKRIGDKAATFVSLYALFGEFGADLYVTYASGKEPVEYNLTSETEKKLEAFWPLAVGKETTYRLNERGYYYSEPQVWTVVLKVAGTESVDIDGRRYETYVIEERGDSDGGMGFRGHKWYHPATGLIVRSRRIGSGKNQLITGAITFSKTANLVKDEVESFSLRAVDFPPGTAAEIVAAAQGTTTADPFKPALAEVERLKREAQEARRALETMKAREAEEQKAREAKLAQLDREIEERRKRGAQQTSQGAQELREREAEIARLRNEAAERQRAAEASQARAVLAAKAREAEMAKLKQEAEQALKTREAEIAKLKQTLAERRDEKASATSDAGSAFSGIDFGRYHALVIGIDNYKQLPKLNTAISDARAVAEVLEKDYGFKVTLLTDPDRRDIINALDTYRETLGRNDNLLIYYAGHGWLDREVDRGYWLPIDAEPKRRSEWVSNATITDTLKALSAKHVMVVADSCYSGTLVRGADMGTRTRTGDYWKQMATKWARVAITSGGLEPVADAGGGGHSPFAKAFIDALGENATVIDGTQLFSQMRRPVMVNARQTPQYADVREAGHDGGDFLFVRKK